MSKESRRRAAFAAQNDEVVLFDKLPMTYVPDEDHEKGLELLQRVGSKENEREHVLLAAMILEHSVEAILSAWLPRSKKSPANSFHQKINLLDACGLVPKSVINALHAVREVRNGFAHRLDVDSVEDLEQAVAESKWGRIKAGLREGPYPGVPCSTAVRWLVDSLHSHLADVLPATRLAHKLLFSSAFSREVTRAAVRSLDATPEGHSNSADMRKAMLKHVRDDEAERR